MSARVQPSPEEPVLTQREIGCEYIYKVALEAMGYKRSGMSFARATQILTADAYGPNGEMYKDSAQADDMIKNIVIIAYETNDNGDFAGSMENGCLREIGNS